MKAIILSLFLISSQICIAQNFTEATNTPFEGVSSGSVAFADVDGDNDQDVLITGGLYIARLYTNDGTGNFSEVTGTPFGGVKISSIAFADVDGDNDQDVLITGYDGLEPTSKLYTNDGIGNFSYMPNPFVGVTGAIAFADVDGDNDQDVLITGWADPAIVVYLYINDGVGNFYPVLPTPFVSFFGSSVSFADVDGDNGQDVLITGHLLGSYYSILYSNDGTGNFSEVTGTFFEGVTSSSISFADVDGDNDQDVLITGESDLGSIAKLYTNDGTGNFSEVIGTPFEGVSNSSIAFADVDGDNDHDVLITGESDLGSITKLYTNDGIGNFSEVMDTLFEGVRGSSIAFADVDGDSDQDVLITGESNVSGTDITKLYINNGVESSTDDLTIEFGLDFSISPNPSEKAILNVSFKTRENRLLNLKVFDLNGRMLIQHNEQSRTGLNTFSIDISLLTKGSYIIQLDYGSQKGIQKFLIQ